MKRENINYLAVGIFVIVAMTILLAALYKITGRVGNTVAYHVYYDNIAGLGDGALVTYAGYQIGYIEAVAPEQTEQGTHYKVMLRVKEGWRIPEDSVARIYASGLLAKTVVNIEEGQSNKYLSPDSEIRGVAGDDLFAVLASVADDMGDLTKSTIRPLLENLNHYVSTLGQAMSDKAPAILDKVDRLASELETSARQLNSIIDTDTEQQVDTILANGEKISINLLALSNQLHDTSQQLDVMLNDAHAVVTDNDEQLRDTVRALRSMIITLANSVDGILFDLEKTAQNMNEFSRQLRSNPGVLLRGKPPVDEGRRQ